jgi:hypothetical protein
MVKVYVYPNRIEQAAQKAIICLVNNKKPCGSCDKCRGKSAHNKEKEAHQRSLKCELRNEHVPEEMQWLAKNDRDLFLLAYSGEPADPEKVTRGLVLVFKIYQIRIQRKIVKNYCAFGLNLAILVPIKIF